MSSLTDEQRQRIELNRLTALALRRAKSQCPGPSGSAINGHSISSIPSSSGSVCQSSTSTAPDLSSRKRFADGSISVSACTSNAVQSNYNTGSVSLPGGLPQPLRTITSASHNCRPRSGPSNFGVQKGVGRNAAQSASGARGAASIAGTSDRSFGNNNHSVLDVHLALLSIERFQVVMSYNFEVIQVLKTVTSRQYDPDTKRWDFLLTDYSSVVNNLKPFCENKTIVLHELPAFIRTAFSAEMSGRPVDSTVPSADLSRVDSVLVQSLFPFQKEGIDYAISRNGRVLFADEMGLGKTIQALGTAAYYRADWPVLVLTPVSVRYNWVEAIKRWLPSIDPDQIFVINSGKDWFPSDSCRDFVVVASYDAPGKVKQLQDEKFPIVILDESHNIKNFKTNRYKCVAPILKSAKRVMLLTGTPALSRPEELYTQIDGVKPKLFHSFQEFGNRYCDPKQHKWGLDYSGASNMEELNLLLRKTLLIRRLKTEVLSQLPTKTRDMVVLDKSSVKHNLKSLRRAAKEMARTDLKGAERHSALLVFFNETAHAKLEAVSTYLEHLLEADSDRKFIVFAHHCVMMDEISSLCSRKDVRFIRIDGKVAAEQRKKLCNDFQNKPDIRVAVLSIKACNSGITLTAASLVIFAELFWNPGILVQAEDRAHRVGQIDNVQVQYLVAKGTADDDLWPLIQEKLQVLTKVGLGKDDFKDASTTIVRDSEQEARIAQERLTDHIHPLAISNGENNVQTSITDYMKQLVEDPSVDVDEAYDFGEGSNPGEGGSVTAANLHDPIDDDDLDSLLDDLEDEDSAAQIEAYDGSEYKRAKIG